MSGGIKLTCAAALLLTGCGSDGKLTIRSIPISPSMAVKPVPARIAEARGHFALGNIALALEGFRKAHRDNPASTDALLGIAACYDRMGRFELSRRYHESALALAPADPELLEAYAHSLDFQGRPSDAAEVRQELAARSPVAPVAEQRAPVGVAAATTHKPAPVVRQAPAAPIGVAMPAPAPTVAAALPLAKRKPETQPPVASVSVALPRAKPVTAPAPAASVTVKLPPARPVPAAVAVAMPRHEPAAPKPAAKPLPVTMADARQQAIVSVRNGPRLERLSLAEVALVTTAPTRWRGKVVRQAAASTTVRFVPLRTASSEVEVRLLNAARHQGLAARTRMALNGKGWKRVSIGDALRVRQKTLVLYSSATSGLAKRLAAQFGFAIAKEARPGQITVLLGRDSVGRTQKRS